MNKSDSVLKLEGMNILIKELGEVDAERFIALIIKEPFNYTKWQENLFEGENVKDLSEKAMKETNKCKTQNP